MMTDGHARFPLDSVRASRGPHQDRSFDIKGFFRCVNLVPKENPVIKSDETKNNPYKIKGFCFAEISLIKEA